MSGGGTALLSVSRRRIELLVNKHSLTAALSCFIPVLQGSCLLILIVISPLSSILATLISSFEPGRGHAMGTSTVMNGQADGVL